MRIEPKGNANGTRALDGVKNRKSYLVYQTSDIANMGRPLQMVADWHHRAALL